MLMIAVRCWGWAPALSLCKFFLRFATPWLESHDYCAASTSNSKSNNPGHKALLVLVRSYFLIVSAVDDD